jgi:hypothetical protein
MRAVDVLVVTCMATSFALAAARAYGPMSTLPEARLYAGSRSRTRPLVNLNA